MHMTSPLSSFYSSYVQWITYGGKRYVKLIYSRLIDTSQTIWFRVGSILISQFRFLSYISIAQSQAQSTATEDLLPPPTAQQGALLLLLPHQSRSFCSGFIKGNPSTSQLCQVAIVLTVPLRGLYGAMQQWSHDGMPEIGALLLEHVVMVPVSSFPPCNVHIEGYEDFLNCKQCVKCKMLRSYLLVYVMVPTAFRFDLIVHSC